MGRMRFSIWLFVLFFIISCDSDPCLKLPACEQYQCRNPEFYCADTLYVSGTIPRDIGSAQMIVQDYIGSMGKSGEIGFSSQSPPPYYWFNITIHFDDGSTYGYEVGPDGNIYEIKRRN